MKSNQIPKAFILLILTLIFLFMVAQQPFEGQVTATQKAIGLASLMAMLMSCLYLPDGYIGRPSQYIWKSITGLNFVYLAILIYLLYQDKKTAVDIIGVYLRPSLKTITYIEQSYAQDCRLLTPDKSAIFQNIYNTLWDLFSLAHAIGWFMKTVICRDVKIILLSSLIFQLLQFSFRNILNNFQQCWWDHVIIDFFGCNMIGIAAGLFFIETFALKKYKWSLRLGPMRNSFWKQIKYFLTHWNLKNIQLRTLSSTKKFILFFYVILFIQLNDFSVFFLKFLYGIPPSDLFCIIRLTLIGFLCVNAAREYYQFTDDKQSDLRVNCFLFALIVLTQWLIVYKHAENIFQHAYINNAGLFIILTMIIILVFILVKLIVSDIMNFSVRFTSKQNISVSEDQPNSTQLLQVNKKIL